jgi:transposase
LPRKYSIEKRLEVVMAGLKSEDSIREICKAHGIETKTYYRWKNLFLEGGKQGLAEEGQSDEHQQELKGEIKRLKELVADLSIENHLLKKSD